MKIKKPTFIVLLFISVLCFSSCAMITNDASSSHYTVYVTKSGHAYHCSSCGTIKKSKHVYSMSKSEAESKGYSRCSKCKP